MASKRPTSPRPSRSPKQMADLLPKGYDDLLGPRSKNALVRTSSGCPGLSPTNWCFSTGRLAVTFLPGRRQEGWGTKVIDRLAGDLRRAYPDMTGLSPRNLKYMRAFAEAWPEELNCAAACCTNPLGP